MDLWDHRFLSLADHIASWSKDPSTKVGAVIVDKNRRIISVGYNGFPKGVTDDHRLNDRQTKYPLIVHAEANAILFANTVLNSTILYTIPFMPCPSCAGLIIQSGITKVITRINKNERWRDHFKHTESMFVEAGIQLLQY